MPHTRTNYHREVKTASFQGRTITVENLTPILAPKVRNRRKREIEAGLYTVFRKYAPGRAEMCIYRAELATCTGKTCHLAGEFPPPRRRGLPVQKRDHIL